MNRQIPSRDEVLSYLRDRSNWDRWPHNPSAGALNLIDDAKRLAAAKHVQKGRAVSLSRPFPVEPSIENPRPALQYLFTNDREGGWGSAMDFYGITYHGTSTTHIDALCHIWTPDGLFDGRDPKEELTFTGAKFGAVDAWSEGILTRGVLLDVPKHRGKPYVTLEEPVHGWELEDILEAEDITLEPGDAVAVYSGREAYTREFGSWGGGDSRAGLHASCLPFIRDHDIAILIWDMMDAAPNDYGFSHTVHGVIPAYGVALLDNALLEPLAKVCAEENRYTFMMSINPLVVPGGTGSPVNPIATF